MAKVVHYGEDATKDVSKDWYTMLLQSLKLLIDSSKLAIEKQINNILVRTYRETWKYIVEYEQKWKKRSLYWEKIIEKISNDMIGSWYKWFSAYNLRIMRRFYTIFPIWDTVSPKLSWSHYCAIIKVENELSRNFYIKEVENENRSVRWLEKQINSSLFERLALSKNKKWVLKLAKKWQKINKPEDTIKDPLVLDFLWLSEKFIYTESDLEQSITNNIQKFLLELWKWFMFVDRQKRINLDWDNFFVDLVFYNRFLKCFFLIDLKIDKLTHQDVWQIQMYVNYYDREIKQKDENPTIWLLLCAEKNDLIIKYTLPKGKNNIFASQYKLYLPDPKEFKQKLEKILF